MRTYLILICIFSSINHTLISNTILITGGAGYIGSHIVYQMKKEGYSVIVLDKEKNGAIEQWAECIIGDYADELILENIFTTHSIHAVIHCAGFIEVNTSVKNPLSFYDNNVKKTITLLQIMVRHKVKNIIFSSSAALYGAPQSLPISEDHPNNPINPYGRTKLMIEMMCQDVAAAHDFNYIMLRYFNAAGALNEYGLGERHQPETHLIPCLLHAAVHDQPVYIFGDNYDTPDHTCVRDYVHVIDIAQAHALALHYLENGGISTSLNLGTGHGFSVKQVIDEVQKVVGKKVTVIIADSREGDPPILVADPTRAYKTLGWKPQHSSLYEIVRSAYEFFSSHR